MTAPSSAHDVVVVGGGPAGSATAALLATAGWDVLLLDRARFPRPKPCAEYLSPGAVAILRQLGALAALPPDAGRRLRGMELHAPGGARYLIEYRDAECGDGRGAAHGLAVPRYDLDAALLAVARARGVRVVEGHRVADVLTEDGRPRGVVGNDRGGRVTISRGRVVIGADGAHSVVASRLRLRRARRWPRRLGLVTHLEGVAWPEIHGEMHVGRRGYVGVAPVGDGMLSLGLVMPLPRGRLGPTGPALQAALRDFPALAARLGDCAEMGPVKGVGPLAHGVRASGGPGFALVGDAAGFLDPFTGEGVFRALRGAEILAPIVDAALRDGRDPVQVGPEYERARRAAFGAKERLTALIQVFVHLPALMNLAVDRLRRRPGLGARLGRVLGDLEPADHVLRPEFLAALFRP